VTIDRTYPPPAADEKTTLVAYLDYHRDTLRLKTAGLDAAQLDTRLPPSDMTLGGMLKHLALVEHSWLRRVFRGEEYAEPWASVDWDADVDWDWHSAAEDTPEQLRELLDATIADSDALIAAASLDDLAERPYRSTGKRFSLRWILLHLVEEYARHNGHADLIRESIDGEVGE
jgi:uncharacterized damage-inducible protein DinB